MNRRAYAATTGCYWVLTLSDGALRMLVLLYFHEKGLSAITLSLLFLLYEACGIFTNAIGGWWAARSGLKVTLTTGLLLQTFSLASLALLPSAWTGALAIGYVMLTQAMSGVAKDLTKMSSKTAVKAVVRADTDSQRESQIWKWVAFLTGSKNALKGVGFFVGGALLSVAGFSTALWLLAAALGATFLAAKFAVPNDIGRANAPKKLLASLSKSRAINLLSLARLFLFASRDAWFVVGLPLFLKSVLGWSFAHVGAVMAIWVIGYGIIQSAAPLLLRQASGPRAQRQAKAWLTVLLLLTVALASLFVATSGPTQATIVLIGLLIYGAVFAMNSALHSYLILYFSDDDSVASDVGFYYMANACGRLLGTFASGAAFTIMGLAACLWISAAFLCTALILTLMLRPPQSAQRTSSTHPSPQPSALAEQG